MPYNQPDTHLITERIQALIDGGDTAEEAIATAKGEFTGLGMAVWYEIGLAYG